MGKKNLKFTLFKFYIFNVIYIKYMIYDNYRNVPNFAYKYLNEKTIKPS